MLTRRELLRRTLWYALSLSGAADLLAGCSPSQPTTAPFASPTALSLLPSTATRVSSATASRTATAGVTLTSTLAPTGTATPAPVPPTPTSGLAYLSVARGKSPGAITRAAVDALGGMTRFVKPGNEVIIKPNICNASYGMEYATTTNPEVVAALVTLCLDAGAKRVRVMDQPFQGTAREAYRVSGIQQAVERAGGQMEVMSEMKYLTVSIPNGKDLKWWKVYQDVLKTDVLINVPIAKTHDAAKITLAMKGLMGVISNRSAMHIALDQRIADLNTLIKPTLNIIDAVRVLAKNGPTGGSLDYVAAHNTVIASQDIVAADAYAATLLFSKRPEDVGYIRFGAEMGLGRYDFGNLTVKEVTA